MSLQTLNLAGREFVVLERTEYDRLARSGGSDDSDLPPLPAADAQGNVPAVAYGRALLARKMIIARRRAGLTQAELARRAGIRAETLNRLEKGRHNPDEATFNKIETALKALGVRI
jgi:DNA-binding XRE family transcriptional regulator